VAGDIQFIAENPAMKSPSLWRDAFTHSYFYLGAGPDQAPYYRPLIVLLDGLNYAWFGLNPFGYHLTNVLLHMGVSLVLLVLGWQLMPSRRAVVFAAIIFAAHPVHVYSVAYISGRTSMVSTLWALLSLCWIVEAERRASAGQSARNQYIAALILALFAFLSKESTVLLPFLAGGMLMVHAPRTKPLLRRHAAMFGLLAVLLLAYLIARVAVLGQLGSTRKPLWFRLDAFASLLTMAKIVGFYPAKLLFPRDLSYLPPFVPALTATDATGIFWLAALGATALFCFYPSGRYRIERYWFFWFLCTAAPVSGLFSLEYLVKCHHAYLPAVGVCMLVGILIDEGLTRLEARAARFARPLGLGLVSLGAIALGISTAVHAQTFSSPRALYQRVIDLEPKIPDHVFAHPAMNTSAQRFATARLNLALLELKEGRCDLALPNLERAHTLARSDDLRFQLRFLRGDCRKRLGDLTSAKKEFEEALRLNTSRFEPAVELALIARLERHPDDEKRYLALACARGALQACR
jgi:protein O-mannosyl-transferase